MTSTDQELLASYLHDRNEDAFAEVVRRHLGLVYSAALRALNSHHLAEEVAQVAFAELARQASRLRPDTVLASWLYQVTRRTAIDVIRREKRRQARETIAAEMKTLDDSNHWHEIAPLLDSAMDALPEKDRAIVLLRYFQNKPLAEIAAAMSSTDNAVQKRLARAIERLRALLARHGAAVTAAATATAISTNAAATVPIITTAASIASAALSQSVGTIVAAGAAKALVTSSANLGTPVAPIVKATVMTTLEKVAALTALLVAGSVLTYQHRLGATARADTAALTQQLQILQERKSAAEQARDAARAELAAAQAHEPSADGDRSELLKLRSQLSMVRRERENARPANDPMSTAVGDLIGRVALLKSRFQHWPGKVTPELLLLAEKDWELQAAKDDLKTEEDIRKAMSELRLKAKLRFADQIRQAYEQFLKANNNVPPTDPEMLRPFLQPESAQLLGGYEIAKSGSVKPPGTTPNSTAADMWALVEKGNFTSTGKPIQDGTNLSDAEHDQYVVIARGGAYWYNAGRPASPKTQ